MTECPSCAEQVQETANFCGRCGRSLKLTGTGVTYSVTRSPVVLTTCLLVLAAFGRWPYAFYELLRLATCGTGAYLAFVAHQQQRRGWMWTMVALALLFNPLLPIRLSRQDWQSVDFIAALVFGVFLLASTK